MTKQPARLGQRIRWSPSVRQPVEGQVVEHATWDEPRGLEAGSVMLIKTDHGKTVSVPVQSDDWEVV